MYNPQAGGNVVSYVNFAKILGALSSASPLWHSEAGLLLQRLAKELYNRSYIDETNPNSQFMSPGRNSVTSALVDSLRIT